MGGIGRQEGGSFVFQQGQTAGDILSLFTGAIEIRGGKALAVGGTYLTATTGGAAALVGFPVAIVGGIAIGVHGYIVVTTAAKNLNKPYNLASQGKSNKEIQNNQGKPATENKPKMLGENGVKTESDTIWQQKGSKARIDIENPKPGERPGQIHYHDAKNTKYMYDPAAEKFYAENPKTGDFDIEAPRRINKLLKNEQFKKGIEKALKQLGEIQE